MCNNKTKFLEEQLSNFYINKEIIYNSKAYKCNFVKIYIYMKILKIIIQIPRKGLITNQNVANTSINFNPDKLKIKILKGWVKQDELSKPYLEYIIDIYYDYKIGELVKNLTNFLVYSKHLKINLRE